MGLEVTPYQEGDVFKVKIRLGDPLGHPVNDEGGPAWTLRDGDKILACVGLKDGNCGIATFWSFISDEARGHGLLMVKKGREIIRNGFEVHKYFRIQAVVRADKEEYSRFIELFGFEREGLMRKAALNKSDIYLYSIVEKD